MTISTLCGVQQAQAREQVSGASLIVMSDTKLITPQGATKLAHAGDKYLYEFASERTAQRAADNLATEHADYSAEGTFAASADVSFSVADSPAAVAEPQVSSQTLTATKQEVPSYKGRQVIALIDTGVREQTPSVVGLYSVLGDDGYDHHGHGTQMATYIHEQYADAEVVSIKALDDTGVGSLTSVLAALDLAIKMQVSVINLSISAKALEGTELMCAEIAKCYESGIEVVCAAGNDGSDASAFIPGACDQACVVGACDESGTKHAASNFGATVDFYLRASSTSEAAARMSALVAEAQAQGLSTAQIKRPDLLFVPSADAHYTTSEGYAGSGTDGLFRGQVICDAWCVDDVAGPNHWVLFTYLSQMFSDKHFRAYAWQTGGAQAAVQEAIGTWTRQGQAFNYAFVFDSAEAPVTGDVWIAMGQLDRVRRNGRYTNEFAHGFWLLQRAKNGEPLWGAMVSGTENESNNGYWNMHIYQPVSRPRSWTTVSYNLTGGTGTRTSGQLTLGSTNYGVYEPLPTKAGYTFTGFSDGREQVYSMVGGQCLAQNGTYWYTITSHGVTGTVANYPYDYTLYATWQPNSKTVYFDANGGYGSTSQVFTAGHGQSIPEMGINRPGYTLAGWSYSPGGGVEVSTYSGITDAWIGDGGTTTLYAVWRPHAYTVRFDANGGQGSQEALRLSYGETRALPQPAISKGGYDFCEWNTKPDGSGTRYAPDQSVSNLTAVDGETITLYAIWDTNLALSVPTKVPCAVKADGTVITPSNWEIRNVGSRAIQTGDISATPLHPALELEAHADGLWFSCATAQGTTRATRHKVVALAPGDGQQVSWRIAQLDAHEHRDLLAAASRGELSLGSLTFAWSRR